jgi:N-acetylmuramic acid 6-phosphate etherase
MKKITENRHHLSENLDQMSTFDILQLMNSEDQSIPSIVNEHLESIEKIIENVITSFENKGRLFYIGCGTSGRLGILDASECHPTFKVDKSLVQGIIAGGEQAVFQSVEGAEDSYEDGYNICKNHAINSNDTVIGISASGTAPFVLGALNYASEKSAFSSLLTFNNIAPLEYIDLIVEIITGPEIISGSTRMKAGTATKMILNMISTTAMIKTFKVYKNYMVDLKVSNKKLKTRAINILNEILNIPHDLAEKLLLEANENIKIAIVMYRLTLDVNTAKIILAKHKGDLRKIIE